MVVVVKQRRASYTPTPFHQGRRLLRLEAHRLARRSAPHAVAGRRGAFVTNARYPASARPRDERGRFAPAPVTDLAQLRARTRRAGGGEQISERRASPRTWALGGAGAGGARTRPSTPGRSAARARQRAWPGDHARCQEETDAPPV
jgi:hypothetical protein